MKDDQYLYAMGFTFTMPLTGNWKTFNCTYRVYANRTQAKKIITILILALFGKGRHIPH